MRNFILAFTALFLLAGCRPYTVDVIQGNVIDKEATSKLRLGMNKDKVDSLLGTPVLTDTFDPNTWIYVYTKQIDGGKIEKDKLILKFKNNKLIKIN